MCYQLRMDKEKINLKKKKTQKDEETEETLPINTANF